MKMKYLKIRRLLAHIIIAIIIFIGMLQLTNINLSSENCVYIDRFDIEQPLCVTVQYPSESAKDNKHPAGQWMNWCYYFGNYPSRYITTQTTKKSALRNAEWCSSKNIYAFYIPYIWGNVSMPGCMLKQTQKLNDSVSVNLFAGHPKCFIRYLKPLTYYLSIDEMSKSPTFSTIANETSWEKYDVLDTLVYTNHWVLCAYPVYPLYDNTLIRRSYVYYNHVVNAIKSNIFMPLLVYIVLFCIAMLLMRIRAKFIILTEILIIISSCLVTFIIWSEYGFNEDLVKQTFWPSQMACAIIAIFTACVLEIIYCFKHHNLSKTVLSNEAENS